MAKFNPEVQPTRDPSYIGLSRPISQPESDRSAAYAGAGVGAFAEGIGDLFKQSVTTADALIKTGIESRVEKEAGPLQESYTTALEASKAMTGQQVSIDQSEGPGGDVMPTNARTRQGPEETPVGVDESLDSVGNLVAARESGKITQSLYLQRLNSIAKAVRTEYPTYRDYIDKQISSVTGYSNTANAYIRSLVADLNAASSRANAEANKYENLALKNLDVVTPQMLARFKKDGDPTAIINAVSNKQIYEAQVKIDANDRAATKGTREQLDDKYTDSASDIGSQIVLKHMNSVGIGGMTPVQIQELLRKSASGEVAVSDEEMAQLAPVLRSYRDAAYAEAYKAFTTPDASGRTHATVMGQKKFLAMLDDLVKPFDEMNKSITDKDYGSAYNTYRAYRAAIEGVKYGMIKDPGAKGYFGLVAAAKDIGGNEWVNELTKTYLKMDIDERFVDMQQRLGLKIVAQPDLARTGVPFSMKDAVSAAQASGAKGTTQGKMNQDTIGKIDIITDSKADPRVKLNAARAAYDYTNRGFLDKFAVDTPDPKNPNRLIPGKYAVFEYLTRPNVVAEAIKVDPSVKPMIKDWVGSEFGNLFRTEINSLKNVVAPVNYNDKTHQFEVVGVAPNSFTDRTVFRLNKGLAAMAGAAKATGDTPEQINAGIANLLAGMGYKPQAPGMTHEGAKELFNKTIPEALMRAITSTQKKSIMER